MPTAETHPVQVEDADVSFYRENGYFIYGHQLLPEPSFLELKGFFEELLDSLPEGKRPEAMDVPHFGHPRLFDWLLADHVLDFVERFLGPNIALWSSHFICKPAGHGQRVPWHEDSAYWGERLSEHEVMTVWLAIDDSLKENGCMSVIPGTHSNGFSDYEEVDGDTHVFGREIVADQVDDSKAVDLEVRAGQCHLHHAKIMHSSNANTSAKRRCGYTMRYIPTTVKVEAGPKHVIYLARGKDLAGNTFGDPTRQFAEGIR